MVLRTLCNFLKVLHIYEYLLLTERASQVNIFRCIAVILRYSYGILMTDKWIYIF